MSKQYLNDRLHSVQAKLADRTVSAINVAIQDFQPEEQILGVAAYLLLACERVQIDPAAVLRVVDNIRLNGPLCHGMKAAAMYFQNEWREFD